MVVAHYNLLDRIGTGRLGELYRARDTRLGRTVALRLVAPEMAGDPARREQLLQDARAATGLSHPNIAALFEIGEADGRLFLACEYVRGETLRAVIGSQPMNARRALDLAIQLADALAEAHVAGAVHGDLRPDTIIVTPKGHAKILDFGLAAWTAGGAARAAASRHAEVGPAAVVGTLPYLSPEQALGEPADPRTDLFSLGTILFETLTGRSPFSAATAEATLARVTQTTPPPPSRVAGAVAAELDAIVGRALAREPAARYQSALALAADLRAVAAILDARAEASRPGPSDRTTRRTGRFVRAGVAAIAFGAVAGMLWVGRDQIGRLGRAIGPRPEPVIAMMPFETDGANRAYFADGLAEDLATRLGQTPGLRVVGRSAIRHAHGETPAGLARDLNAAVVLTGAVRSVGQELTLVLELVDPAHDVPLWRGQYRRPASGVVALQAEIAQEVARALRVALGPSEARARTASRTTVAEAYDLYMRGRAAAARGEAPAAIAFFERAVAVDPALAEAHAGLAMALGAAGRSGDLSGPDVRVRIRQAAARATSIDPDLPQAHVAQALAAPTLAGALTHLRRSTEVDPSFAESVHLMGAETLPFDPERALVFFEQALALDSRLDDSRYLAGVAHLLLGDTARAGEVARHGRETRFGPRWAILDNMIVLVEGRPASAVDRLEAALATAAGGDAPGALPALGLARTRALQATGRLDEAFGAATENARDHPRHCEARAVLAGLRADRQALGDARRTASEILGAADRADAPPALARCAATAAAALGNGGQAAAWLMRIARQEETVRRWASDADGAHGGLLLRHRAYPWNKVAGHSAVLAAERDLAQAYERLRQVIAATLGET